MYRIAPPSLETERVGRWIGILGKCLRIHNEGLKKYLSICGDILFREILFLVIFRGFVWQSDQLQRLRVGHWMGILKRFLHIRDQEI